ncbi:MAG: SGNH/GDSL hydrolase family protein [Candidatus Acidiferrales bacterium]
MDSTTRSSSHRQFRSLLAVSAASLLVLAVACSSEKPAQPPRAGDALRVLFLGNSYTYYNNLPRLVEELAAAAGRKIETRMIAPGGASLADHAANARTAEAIRSGGWDFVVLQEQSALGAVYLVNGEARVANPEAFFAAARKLDAEIRKAGAKTVFYHTWPQREAPDSDRAMLDYANMHIARELGAAVAPVGLAWQQASAEVGGASLYAEDGSHPSRTGSYLAAAVIAATLTGASPVGGPARISGAPVNPDTGAVGTGASAVLVDLPARFAGELQRIAWQNHEKLAAADGAIDLPAPAALALPQMPAGGRRPTREQVSGRWLGSLALYPQPATLEIWLAQREAKPGESVDAARAEWKTAMQVRFASGRLDDITAELDQVRITDYGFDFVNPAGPNGGIVKFRAAFLGDRLAGIAEIIVEGEPIYGIGTFELKRVR